MDLKALHKLTYGMYVVASRKADRLNGQIANTVFQVASEPPTVAVSINKGNLTHEFIKESKVFTASILCEDTPFTFIGRFGFRSGRETAKFEGVNYTIGKTGAPVVLENAVGYMEARVTQEIDVDTHTLFVGEIVNAELISGDPCMTYDYYHQVKKGATPRAAATYVAEKPEEKKEARTTVGKYKCKVCGYVYDPDQGDPDGGVDPGTPFADIPDTWVCPVCGAAKSEFEKAS